MKDLKNKYLKGLWVEKVAFCGFLTCTAYFLFRALPGNVSEGAASIILKVYFGCIGVLLLAWFFRNPYFILGLLFALAGIMAMTISVYGIEASERSSLAILSSITLLMSAFYALLRGVKMYRELSEKHKPISLDRTS